MTTSHQVPRQCFILLALLPLVVALNVVGQTNLDSLWGVWDDPAKADTSRLAAMSAIAHQSIRHDPDTALYLSQLLYDLAEKAGSSYWMSKSFFIKGKAYRKKGDYDQSIESSQRSLGIGEEIGDHKSIAEALRNIGLAYHNQNNFATANEYYIKSMEHSILADDKIGTARCLNSMGIVSREFGNHAKAVEHYEASYKLWEEIGDADGMAKALNNIGVLHKDLGDFDSAIEYYTKSLEIKTSIDDKYGMANTINNIGAIHAEKGELEKAGDHFQQGLALMQEVNNQEGVVLTMFNIGNYYLVKKDFSTAMDYFERCRKICEQYGFQKYLASSYLLMGDLYIDRGDTRKAIPFFIKGLELHQELGVKHGIRYASKYLYKAYKKIGQTDKALEMHELTISMKDSIMSAKNQRKLMKEKYKHEYDRKMLKDSLEFARKEAVKDLELEKQEARLEKEETQKYALAVVLALVIILVLVSWRALRQKKRTNQKLRAQKAEIERNNEQLTVANDDLRSFAYTISHDLKAPLRGIGTLSEILQEDMAGNMSEEGKKLINLLGNRVNKMSQLITGVLNYTVAGKDQLEKEYLHLNLLVPDIVDLLAAPESIDIKVDSKMPEVYYNEAQLSQVFQNLIGNAVKYMDKEKGVIDVTHKQVNGQYQFTIRDNGPGIERGFHEEVFRIFNKLKSDKDSTGIGLAVVNKIVSHNGGRVWLESEPGEGSTFHFTVNRHRKGVK